MYDEKKEQEHLGFAEEVASKIASLPHREQLETFQRLRTKLLELRKEQAERIAKDIAYNTEELNVHTDGSKIIASEL